MTSECSHSTTTRPNRFKIRKTSPNSWRRGNSENVRDASYQIRLNGHNVETLHATSLQDFRSWYSVAN
jgi:hypothetical protein